MKLIKIADETIELTKKSGNGILRILASMDNKGNLKKYSFAYINFRLCYNDNDVKTLTRL